MSALKAFANYVRTQTAAAGAAVGGVAPNGGQPSQAAEPNAQGPGQSGPPNGQAPGESDAHNAQDTSAGPDPHTAQAGIAAPQVAGKLTYEGEWKSPEFGKTSMLKGGIKGKLTVSLEMPNKGEGSAPVKLAGTGDQTVGKPGTNVGVKLDMDLVKKKHQELLGLLKFEEVKGILSCALTTKKTEIAVGITGKLSSPYPWLKFLLTGKFTFIGVEWKKVKENMNDVTITSVELGGGGQVEGTWPLDKVGSPGVELKATVALVATAFVAPNWPVILAEGAEKAAEDAGVATAEDLASTAIAAATEAALVAGPPLLAAIVVAQGIYAAGEKGALEAAILEGAADARQAALDYANTITGSEGCGPGPRAKAAVAAAKKQLTQIASSHKVSLDDLMAELRKRAPDPDFPRIYAQARQQTYAAYYGNVVKVIQAWRKEHYVLAAWTTEGDDIASANKKVDVVFAE